MNFNYETKRLILKIENRDAAPMVQDFFIRNKLFFSSSDYAHNDDFYTLPFMEKMLDGEYQLAMRQQSVRFWLYEKSAPGAILGTISFNGIRPIPYSSCEVGYRLDEMMTGRGYAYEALSFMCDEMAKDLSLHRITAHIMPENVPSLRLIERLGFRYEGLCKRCVYINNNWEDHYLYAKLYED